MTTRDPAVDFLACLMQARAAGWIPRKGSLFAVEYDGKGGLKLSACAIGAALLGAGYLFALQIKDYVGETEAMRVAKVRWPTIDLSMVATMNDSADDDEERDEAVAWYLRGEIP